jgi:predicted small integral membrane protein
MDTTWAVTSLLLIRLVVIGGLALWMTLAVINNIRGFRGGVAAIGQLMGMKQLRQPPTNESPLLSRAVEAERWHRLVFGLTVVFEAGCAALLWCATVLVAGSALGSAAPDQALVMVNLALAAFIALLFFFMLGGTWFAYYIHQELLNVSHVAWIAAAIAAAILFNLVA